MSSKKSQEDKESRLRYYIFVYQKLDAFRNQIYSRASLVIAISALLIGSAWNILNSRFPYQQSINQVTSNSTTTISTSPTNNPIFSMIAVILLILFLGFALLSIFFSLFSVHPFYWPKKGKKGIKTKPNTSAFSYIVKSSREEFKKNCSEKGQPQLLEDALDGIYNVSAILNERYRHLQKSYVLLFAAILLFAILMLYCLAMGLYGG